VDEFNVICTQEWNGFQFFLVICIARYLYQEVSNAYQDDSNSIFSLHPDTNLCQLKDGFSFHLFTSHTPCKLVITVHLKSIKKQRIFCQLKHDCVLTQSIKHLTFESILIIYWTFDCWKWWFEMAQNLSWQLFNVTVKKLCFLHLPVK